MSNSKDSEALWQATTQLVLCLTTAPSQAEAKTLAHGLVKQGLAACVNVLPNVTSVYCWQGEIKESGECLLLIKALKTNATAIAQFIKSQHSYACPELIAVEIEAGLSQYLEWLGATPIKIE